MKKFVHLHILCVLILFLSACQATRKIPEGEKLYTGASLKLDTEEKLTSKKEIRMAAESAIKVKPNKKFLGMRPKLWFYYAAGNPPKNGFKRWMQNKLGEPPVFIKEVRPDETAGFIDAKLFNIGVFNTQTTADIEQKQKTAHLYYTLKVHNPYQIADFQVEQHVTVLQTILQSALMKTLLKPGSAYKLEALRLERARIDAVLKDSGYFYFNPDYLEFVADTMHATKSVNLFIRLKKETPERALQVYTINDVLVNPAYSISGNKSPSKADTLIVDSIIFFGRNYTIRPKVLTRSIYFKSGDVYSRRNHNITLNRLMGLGNYKFVSAKFSAEDSLSSNKLNVMLELTPMPKRTVRAEVNLISKSNDFIGPRINVNYKNRNTFNGAELLNFRLGSSYEIQFGGTAKNVYALEIGPVVELILPKFLVPFNLKKTGSFYVPKTHFTISYNFLSRINYFNLTSLKFNYGYKWKENIKTDHELNPVNITFTTISNRSLLFDSLLDQNSFLRRNYQDQFISGLFYAFTYNEQVIQNQRSQFYLRATAEVAGNSLSLLKRIAFREHPSAANPSKFAGTVYSQFFETTIDARNYFNFRRKNKVAVRLFSGFGIPYQNSATLPYVRQFFSGGANSLRAFSINEVGPGTYHSETNTNLAFIQPGGDVKLEGNVEYRCNLAGIFKGAVFVDAGNIWQLHPDSTLFIQPFALKRFYKEIAVGTGVGLRLDASFFVIRLDVGVPLRKPWLEEGNRWTIGDIKLSSGEWRRKNLVFNLAIGYPF